MDLTQSSSSGDQVMMAPPCPSPYVTSDIDSPVSFHLHHRSHAHARHPHNVGIETRPVMERLRFAVAPASVYEECDHGEEGRYGVKNNRRNDEYYYWRFDNDNFTNGYEEEDEEDDDYDEEEEEDDEEEDEGYDSRTDMFGSEEEGEEEDDNEDNQMYSQCTAVSGVSQSFPMIGGQCSLAPPPPSSSSLSQSISSSTCASDMTCRLGPRSKSKTKSRSRSHTRSHQHHNNNPLSHIPSTPPITEAMSAPPTTTTITSTRQPLLASTNRRRTKADVKHRQERPFSYVASKPIVIPERSSQPTWSPADLQMRHRQLRDLLARKQQKKINNHKSAGCSVVDEEIMQVHAYSCNALTSAADSSSSESD